MNDVIEYIDAILLKISPKSDAVESMEWYLKNNLQDYKKILQGSASLQEIENATRALTRFCTESMDWDNPLYKECCEITSRGMRLAR